MTIQLGLQACGDHFPNHCGAPSGANQHFDHPRLKAMVIGIIVDFT
jgi:hypothetical protein